MTAILGEIISALKAAVSKAQAFTESAVQTIKSEAEDAGKVAAEELRSLIEDLEKTAESMGKDFISFCKNSEKKINPKLLVNDVGKILEHVYEDIKRLVKSSISVAIKGLEKASQVIESEAHTVGTEAMKIIKASLSELKELLSKAEALVKKVIADLEHVGTIAFQDAESLIKESLIELESAGKLAFSGIEDLGKVGTKAAKDFGSDLDKIGEEIFDFVDDTKKEIALGAVAEIAAVNAKNFAVSFALVVGCGIIVSATIKLL